MKQQIITNNVIFILLCIFLLNILSLYESIFTVNKKITNKKEADPLKEQPPKKNKKGLASVILAPIRLRNLNW